MMKICIFAYSKKGIETARRIEKSVCDECSLYTVDRLADEGFHAIPKPSSDLYEKAFNSADALIFCSSCGIAVRSIAPYIKSKTTDPAVIVVDETGKFCVSLLSGHIGGANAFAEKIASSLGAIPVITTATDVCGRFSVDSWAAKSGLVIADMGAVKAVSAAILEKDVPLVSDIPIKGDLPCGVCRGDTGEIGIAITFGTGEPFDKTLRLIPKCLRLGIGCRRGTSKESIRSAVETVMKENALDMRALKGAASIILKADEPGLIDFCREEDLKILFYSAEELRSVEGDFMPSEFVKSITGVDNVCERAAMLTSNKLLVRKTAIDGVTVAIGIEKTEVSFG